MFYSLRQIAPESKFSHLLYLDVFEQIIPLALICEVLSQTQRWEKRERALNMVSVIVVIIAMGLLPCLSIAHVLQKIASGLRYVWPDPCMKLPGASALSQRRQQLGVLPLRRLFERVCRPRATKETPGAFLFGLRLMAIDSTVENVPDTFANALTFGRQSLQHGPAAYPQVRGIYLLECATHLIVDALFRPHQPNEQQGAYARLALGAARHAGAAGSRLSRGAPDPADACDGGARAGSTGQQRRSTLCSATLRWHLPGLLVSGG